MDSKINIRNTLPIVAPSLPFAKRTMFANTNRLYYMIKHKYEYYLLDLYWAEYDCRDSMHPI